MKTRSLVVAGSLGVVLLGGAVAAGAGARAQTNADAAVVLAAPTDADLAYLTGTWRSESPDGSVVEEHWLEPAHGTISGVLRWVNAKGEISLLEILTIQSEDGVGVFRWRHFDGVLTPWASEADGPSVVTIESFAGNKLVMVGDPDAGGVQRMTYDGSTPGHLTATLEFGPDSGRNPLVIEFEKQ